MRRENGYGTVYKLPGKRRKPWIARITTGWELTETSRKQLYQTIGYFPTKQEAVDALTLHRIDPVSPKAKMTLKELYKEWSESTFQFISEKTQGNYKAAWKRLALYESVPVRDIRTAHLQTIIDNNRRDDNLSRSTLEKLRLVAVSMFNYAMENDIVTKNYAKFVRLPKKEKTEKERFSQIEVKKLSDLAENNEWAATALILIYSGMRISEMLGLTQFNVDMKRGIITGGVKTDAGKNRMIPIHPKIQKYIQYWLDKKGNALLCDENGNTVSQKVFRKHYYHVLAEANVRRLTPHACRHTFASMMAEAGADTTHIQKIIGHSDYSTTANIYTHIEIESLKEAINKI